MSEPPGLAQAIDEIAEAGWSRRSDLVGEDLVRALEAEAREAFEEGRFRHARVGRGAHRQLRPEVRTDRVLWLDPDDPTPSQARYLALMEEMRLALNRELQLGLFEYEGHLAVYPPGSFYRRHLDQSPSAPLRTVTCITYLNRHWQPEDGGQLRLYLGGDPEASVDLLPEAGTTLLFLADRLEHEVLPSRRDRAGVTGWFRRRP